MAAQAKTPSLKNGILLNGKWEIIEHIATGGKGEVYRARQTNLDREVVVKTISKDYLAKLKDDEEHLQTELQRFHREALAMAKVRHPNVVQVYDQDEAVVSVEGTEESIQYLVMEYIEGPILRSTMPPKGFCANEQQAREWIRNYFLLILDGIRAIHDLGIVHRDIKPENVILENGIPKIMDFGVAGGVQWSELTKSHQVEGTITYMAPEQFMDLGETDVQGDVYALGKVLYESIVGKLDKKTASPLKCVSLECPETPFWKRLDSIISKATAENKEERTPSVQVLKENLESLLDDFDESKLRFAGLTLPRPNRKQIALGLAALAFIVGLIITSNLIHHAIMVEQSQQAGESSVDSSSATGQRSNSSRVTVPAEDVSKGLPFIGRDGSVLRPVPGGNFTLPGLLGSGKGKSLQVAPFFIGETEVTNAQFVIFLNRVLNRITVEGEMVKSKGKAWLRLGEVFQSYEPIIFMNGNFSVKDPRYISYPVVRVTGNGAAAYARFYGDRLPTELEWYAAALSGKEPPSSHREKGTKFNVERTDQAKDLNSLAEASGVSGKLEPPSQSPVEPSQIPHQVSQFPPNRYGVRGLLANIGEWGQRKVLDGAENDEAPKYVILGGLEGTWLLGSTLIRGPEHSPSQAFAHVGFRVVHNAIAKQRGEK